MINLFLGQVCNVNKRYRIPKGQFKKGRSRETGKKTKKIKTKKHSTICVVQHYAQKKKKKNK